MFLGIQKRLQKKQWLQNFTYQRIYLKNKQRERGRITTERLEGLLELFWISQHLISLQQCHVFPTPMLSLLWKNENAVHQLRYDKARQVHTSLRCSTCVSLFKSNQYGKRQLNDFLLSHTTQYKRGQIEPIRIRQVVVMTHQILKREEES